MRSATIGLAVLALAGCVTGVPPQSYDPNLYDANGNVVTPVAQAQPAPPECREVARNITVGGKPQQAYATACRQSDGSWRFTD